MPSLSPGSESASRFAQILPGAPTESLQSLTTFTFRWKRYVVYISGKQLNILRSPKELVQAVSFDEELVAVRAEGDQSAKIAVASEGNVWVLESQTDNWNQVTWRKVLLLKREDAGDKARSLSWGNDGELLVGGSRLVSLFSVLPSSREGTPVKTSASKEYVEERHVLWSKSLPSEVQAAAFSPNASLIASFGPRDRLVKIWRRLSYEEGLFDYAYLLHPGPVTHIEWRKPDPPKLDDDTEESDDARARAYGMRNDDDRELLYTFCADGVLRVWKEGGQQDQDVLKLHSSIDLVTAIPHSPSLTSKSITPPKPARYAFVLPSGALSDAIAAAVSKHLVGKVTHSLEHLKEISTKQPDAVVTMDGNGRMSAWGLQTIGHKRRPSTPSGESKKAYHIAHAEDLDLKVPAGTNARFESWFDGDQVNIVVHRFDGVMSWWQGGVEHFFSPAAQGSERLMCVGTWCGARSVIHGMRSLDNGLLAWSREGGTTRLAFSENQELQNVWQHRFPEETQSTQVLDARLITDHAGMLSVDASNVFVLDASGKIAGMTPHSLKNSDGLRLWEDPSRNREYLLIDHSGAYVTVSVQNTKDDANVHLNVGECKPLPIRENESSAIDSWKTVHLASHPRKQGWLRLVGVGQDGAITRRDVAARSLWEARFDAKEAPLSFPSGFSNPSILEATSSLATLISADGRQLAIIDLKDGYVEYRQTFAGKVQELRLNVCTDLSAGHEGDANSTLAIIFDDSVDILAQARYEPAHSAEQHTWHHLKRLSISGIGPSISNAAWLPSGELVIAAGNALFRSDEIVAGTDVVPELRDRLDLKSSAKVRSHSLMSALRQPLVSWHPHFLQQLSLRGKMHAATGILRRLERTLRFYTEGDELHPLLDAEPHSVIAESVHSNNALLEGDSVNSLKQQLEVIDLPKTSDSEQERLKLVLQTIVYVQEHLDSLDENALRYLFSWKLHVLELESKRSREQSSASSENTSIDEQPPPLIPAMSWREIVFAYHSETQQPLLEALHNYYGSKLDWTTVRNLGIPAWLHAVRAAQSEGSDLASLEQIFDSLAQTAFRSTYPPDPTRASLYFLALRKKATLLALWRVAVGNKEQRNTSNFLKRDFAVEENRTAARKNAYALMGKRRFEYAAAFFLLANDPSSAIRILAGQCQDLPLAIAVARVYCDDGSPELLKFMQDRVLPEARKSGDRWLLSWVHDLMGHPSLAAQALIVPIDKLEVDDAERMPRHWQQDDPLTLRLYQHLRDKPAKPGQKIKSLGGEQHEHRAVLRSARILRKMGLWLLALELVSTWHFKPVENPPPTDDTQNGTATNGVHDQPKSTPSMFDDFATPSPAPEAPKSMLDDFAALKQPPAPKSLLDDFGSMSLQPTPTEDKAKSDREAKAAELMAKLKAKKEQANNPRPPSAEEKRAPTQFKEPEANSILDSFGF